MNKADQTENESPALAGVNRLTSRLDVEVFPYAFIQFTCDAYPKVTHISKRMLDYLEVTEDMPQWQDFFCENIYFFIPFEERDYFKSQLERVHNTERPIDIRHHLIRNDASTINMRGWLDITANSNGEDEYFIVYKPVKEEGVRQIPSEANSYLQALESAYGVIFEVNISNNTVECIHGRETSTIGSIADIRMTIDSAKEFWINNHFYEPDRETMRSYFEWILTPDTIRNANRPLQAEFRIIWQGVMTHFLAVAVQRDDYTILVCLRDITKLRYSNIESRENESLRRIVKHLQGIIKNESNIQGLIAYEIIDDKLRFAYLSENVRRSFDITDNDYTNYLNVGISTEEFLERVNVSPEQHQTVINGGSITLSLTDEHGQTIPVTALCSVRREDGALMHDIFLYDRVPHKAGSIPSTGIFARTFGYFDLFIDGRPVIFSNQKEKELLALLVDRNGGTVTPNEAIELLWENEQVTERVKTRYRKLAMTLKNTLEAHDIGHILINSRGTRSIDTSAITCDYYEYLSGNPKYRSAFHNAYLSGYSWAETTLATLWNM